VAEFLVSGLLSFDERLMGLWQRLTRLSGQQLNQEKHKLGAVAGRLRYAAGSLLQSQENQLEHMQQKLRYAAEKRLYRQNDLLNSWSTSLRRESSKLLKRQHDQLKAYEKFLRASDPEQIFRRGFSYTTVNGKPLHKVNKLRSGDLLETLSDQHIMLSRLESSEKRKKNEQEKK
jgi:exodeoxyribonuclease VII large subunit